MDSNSSSYLVLGATVVLLTIVFFFLSGMKRKPSPPQSLSGSTLPFELRTSHFFQLLTYLWFPLILSIPVLVYKGIHQPQYFILILIFMVILMAWFIAAQHVLEKDREEEN